MRESDYRTLVSRFFALFFALPFAIVAIMVRFGPLSGTIALPGWFTAWFWAVFFAVYAVSCIMYSVVFLQTRFLYFCATLILTTAILSGTSILAALCVHRDFFTSAFQNLLSLPGILLAYIQLTNGHRLRKRTLRTLGRAGYVITIFFTEWLILMGYAIATRSEPRPVESIMYNLYNLVLVFFIFYVSHQLDRKGYATVISGKETLIINSRDISGMAGQKKTRLLYAFASAPDKTLRCPEIQTILSDGTDTDADGCAQCVEQPAKAALCSKYRSTYNSILDLKKMLEILEIGSISASENRRNIITEGWKLNVFENVWLAVKK
jgi:hypothetical protein